MMISVELSLHVYENDLGQCYAAGTGFQLTRKPDTVLTPDFAFVSAPRLTYKRTGGYAPIVPDLVLETQSFDESESEISAKIHRWHEFGARMILDLSPVQQTIPIYWPNHSPELLHREDTLHDQEVLPGFSMRLSQIFRTQAQD